MGYKFKMRLIHAWKILFEKFRTEISCLILETPAVYGRRMPSRKNGMRIVKLHDPDGILTEYWARIPDS